MATGTSEAAAPPPDGPARADVKGILGWCLYDWANSAFPTLIATFVFATYYTRAVAETPEQGTTEWGYMTAAAAGVIAIAAPVLGAVADFGGRCKPWLAVLTALTAVATAALWFATPGPDSALYALLVAGIATVGFELGMVFYNALLPEVAPPRLLGRVSGWGWGLGYLGGLAALGVSYVGFVGAETPWFGVGTEAAANVRAVPVVAGIWIAVFCLPIFVLTPDRRRADARPIGAAVRLGLRALADTLRRVRSYRTVARFLLARMLYTDGLNTLFAFGGIYAAGTFGMDQTDVLMFGAALNVTAGLGAAGFAVLDDLWGQKPVILVAVGAISAIGAAMLVISDETVFWGLGLALGAFFGPAQAASRTMMARLAPPELRTEFFGLYALSGKATAFLGPLLLGWVTMWSGSQRTGMATILVFLLAGLLLLRPLPAGVGPASDAQTAGTDA